MRRIDGAREALVSGALAIALVMAIAIGNPAGAAFTAREFLFDRLIDWFPRTGPDANILAVDIDSASIARFGAWPWSRAQIATLIEKTAAAGPRAIALNVLIDGPDSSGARAVIARIAREGNRPDLAKIAEGFPDGDATLSKAADRGVPVIFGLGIGNGGAGRSFPSLTLAAAGEGAISLTPVRLPEITGPPQLFDNIAGGFGVLSLDTDADGWLRRFPLIFEFASNNTASLHAGFALETIRVAEGAATLVYDSARNILEAGSQLIHAPAGSLVRFHPRPPGYWNSRTISAARVLDGVRLPVMEKTIVVIGSSAPETGAFLPAAVLGAVSTLQAQTEAIDQLRSGVSLKRIPGALWSEWGLAVAAGILALTLAILFSPVAAGLGLGAVLLALLTASIFLFARQTILLDVTPALEVAVLSAGTAILTIHNRVRANRLLVEARFARYLAPAVVDILARDPGLLRIAVERREVTALFTDLEGFTPFSERTPPQQLIATLNDYFEMMARIAVEHGGMVDKIVGDAIHVFFNMPLDQPDHAERAVACARALHLATDAWRKLPGQVSLGFGRTRIGVDTGWATVGDVGGRDKLDYTAHGEAVNRAARLQGMAREVESGVLIGEGTARRLPNLVGLASAGSATPRGMTQAQCMYTLE